MRIIIETDEEADAETIKTAVREELTSAKKTPKEATDAGKAPSAGPTTTGATRPEGTPKPTSPPTHTLNNSGQTVDGGAAPQSRGTSTPKDGKADHSTGQATDAGKAPKTNPATRRERSTQRDVSHASRPPKQATGSTFEGKTDAGRPSVPTNGSQTAAPVEQTAMDYEAIVAGTVEEVKDRVRGGHLDIARLIEAERAGEERNTLIDWLERQQS